MGTGTKIEWCDHTFNPWWGCTKVYEGCAHCYAEKWARRCGQQVWGRAQRRTFGEKHWGVPHTWNRKAEREGRRLRVFCGSMCDVFEDNGQIDRDRRLLWWTVEHTPHLDWLLLTKRPENFPDMVRPSWHLDRCPRNVWLGISASTQKRLNDRLWWLLNFRATVRFISLEPLLEPVSLRAAFGEAFDCDDVKRYLPAGGIPWWLIIGGESGPGARPCDVEWVEDLRAECAHLGIPCFVKQMGDNQYFGGEPFKRIGGPKGGDWREWPEKMRVREFPK